VTEEHERGVEVLESSSLKVQVVGRRDGVSMGDGISALRGGERDHGVECEIIVWSSSSVCSGRYYWLLFEPQ